MRLTKEASVLVRIFFIFIFILTGMMMTAQTVAAEPPAAAPPDGETLAVGEGASSADASIAKEEDRQPPSISLAGDME